MSYTTMTFEQLEHFLRHLYIHAQEIRNGTFDKDIRSYMRNVECARYLSNEIAHTLVHLMRLKKFKGYENADYRFDTEEPSVEELKSYKFTKFVPGDFSYGITIANTMRMGLVSDEDIVLPIDVSQQQMERFGKAIKDCSAILVMLEILSKKRKYQSNIQNLKAKVQEMDSFSTKAKVLDAFDELKVHLDNMSWATTLKEFS